MISYESFLGGTDVQLALSPSALTAVNRMLEERLGKLRRTLSIPGISVLGGMPSFLSHMFRGSSQWPIHEIYERLFNDIGRSPTGTIELTPKVLWTLDQAVCDSHCATSGLRYSLLSLGDRCIALIVYLDIGEIFACLLATVPSAASEESTA